MKHANFLRLFSPAEIDEHGIRVIREHGLEGAGNISWISTPSGGVALVHEYADDDGFEVYTSTPNRISETRVALGLPPERPDDERPFGEAKSVTFKGAGK